MAILYRRSEYERVIERALRVEADLATFPLVKQAHYCIYRGASHLALQQADQARLWLGRANQYRAQYPGLVVEGHAQVLDTALSELARRDAAAGAPPPAATGAPATAAAPPPVVQ
jgi:hypothetical protein